MELIKRLEAVTGKFAEIRLAVLEGDDTYTEKLTTFLDCYAFAAYTIMKLHPRNKSMLMRLEAMNGLWILGSQLTKEDDTISE